MFKCAPPLLQWERGGGARTSRRKSGGTNVAWTRFLEVLRLPQLPGLSKPLHLGEQSALPRTGCPTPTCSGNPTFQVPRLTGPKFFPATWAVSPEPLVSLHTEPVEQQSSSFDQHLVTEDFQTSDTSGMLNPLSPGGVGRSVHFWPPHPFSNRRARESWATGHPRFAPRRFASWTMASSACSRRRCKAAMRPHTCLPLGFHSQAARCCKGAQH